MKFRSKTVLTDVRSGPTGVAPPRRIPPEPGSQDIVRGKSVVSTRIEAVRRSPDAGGHTGRDGRHARRRAGGRGVTGRRRDRHREDQREGVADRLAAVQDGPCGLPGRQAGARRGGWIFPANVDADKVGLTELQPAPGDRPGLLRGHRAGDHPEHHQLVGPGVRDLRQPGQRNEHQEPHRVRLQRK